MLYCSECGLSKGYPVPSDMMKSYGRCEICGKKKMLNEVPDNKLPIATKSTGAK